MDLPMAASDLPSVGTEQLDDDLVEAGLYASARQAAAHGLVVLAMGHPYWLVEAPEGFRLLVEREWADLARRHLAAYDLESTRWPPAPIVDPWTPGKIEFITPLLWAVTVLVLFQAGGRSPAWVDRGALD